MYFLKVGLRCQMTNGFLLVSFGLNRRFRTNPFMSRPLVLNRWVTARKSGGPQTFAFFNNGFASQMRLRNAGAYRQPYVHIDSHTDQHL